jgi:hypothetical protein
VDTLSPDKFSNSKGYFQPLDEKVKITEECRNITNL